MNTAQKQNPILVVGGTVLLTARGLVDALAGRA